MNNRLTVYENYENWTKVQNWLKNIDERRPFPTQNVTKDIAENILTFLPWQQMIPLSEVSKAWRVTVIEHNQQRRLILSEIIEGFKSGFTDFLQANWPVVKEGVSVKESFIEPINSVNRELIPTNKDTFTLNELRDLKNIWKTYLKIRGLEYGICRKIEMECQISFFGTSTTFQSSIEKYSSDDLIANDLAIPYLKALVKDYVERKKDIQGAKLDEEKINIVEKHILSKFTSTLIKTLKDDASPEWLGQLEKVAKLIKNPLGKKLSALEAKWHIDVASEKQKNTKNK